MLIGPSESKVFKHMKIFSSYNVKLFHAHIPGLGYIRLNWFKYFLKGCVRLIVGRCVLSTVGFFHFLISGSVEWHQLSFHDIFFNVVLRIFDGYTVKKCRLTKALSEVLPTYTQHKGLTLLHFRIYVFSLSLTSAFSLAAIFSWRPFSLNASMASKVAFKELVNSANSVFNLGTIKVVVLCNSSPSVRPTNNV